MNKVKVTVYDNNDFYAPVLAKNFIQFFQKKIDSVPDEFKDAVKIAFEARSGCGDSLDLIIDMYYFRPQTESEIQAEAKEGARRLKNDRAAKLASFEQLKRELGL